MDNLYTYSGLALVIILICAICLFIKKKYFSNIFDNAEIKVIKKMIKKDIHNQKIQLTETSVVLKNFKILDLWEVHVAGRESFKKMEVFIEHKGKFYEYEAIWNSEIFEKNKKTGFNDSPIVISTVRQSVYVSLNEWEETKSLGV